jgi:hypothetical protein
LSQADLILIYILKLTSPLKMKVLPLLQVLLASFAAVRAQSCSPYRLVWFSCTGSGNEMDSVGNAVLSSLQAKGLNADGRFVNYPANRPRDQSTQEGATQLASDMSTYANDCPDQTFILGGYSQGVIVLHRASLPQNIIKRVAAVTVFGDPVPKSSFYPICETHRAAATCGALDTWCNGGDKEGGVQNLRVSGGHQDYVPTADAAVNAIMDSIKNPFTGQCTPPAQPKIQFDQLLNFG